MTNPSGPAVASVKRYRTRPRDVHAIQFDGTAAGVERVVSWMSEVAPGIPIRPSTEYRGGTDLIGHLELEVRDMEHGCMGDDWVVVTEPQGIRTAWFVDDPTFQKYYEESPA